MANGALRVYRRVLAVRVGGENEWAVRGISGVHWNPIAAGTGGEFRIHGPAPVPPGEETFNCPPTHPRLRRDAGVRLIRDWVESARPARTVAATPSNRPWPRCGCSTGFTSRRRKGRRIVCGELGRPARPQANHSDSGDGGDRAVYCAGTADTASRYGFGMSPHHRCYRHLDPEPIITPGWRRVVERPADEQNPSGRCTRPVSALTA